MRDNINKESIVIYNKDHKFFDKRKKKKSVKNIKDNMRLLNKLHIEALKGDLEILNSFNTNEQEKKEIYEERRDADVAIIKEEVDEEMSE